MKLLSPIRIGNIELKNRVVSTAHEAYPDFYQPGADGERYMAYQERRAAGGAGLIILTAMHVHQSSQVANHFNYEATDLARKLQELSTRVHRHGAKLISQLFHLGVVGKSEGRTDLQPLWGFSDTISISGEMAHEMTGAEIEDVIDAFADSARLVVDNGVDGVEIHAAHGYLIQQSFSPFANKRTDKWGEPLAFAKEIARRVRAAIGPDKVMGLRIVIDDFISPAQGGVGHERLCAIAADLIGTGLFDYLNHSEGAGGGHYARAVGSFRHPLGEFLPLTRALKAAIGSAVPLIGVGKIPTPDLAERALEEGDCDLVGMTRAQISDPDLVNKLQGGQGHRIRICTGANQGCIDRGGMYPITCIQNPEVGEENRFKELDARPVTPKRVLVVGGGPAGMKAAEIAAKRGHDVVLAEAGHRLGGRFNLVEGIGDAANLLASISWIEQELALLKVDIRTQTVVDAAFVESVRPDAIVMATGALPNADLGIASDGSIPVISTDDAVQGLFEGEKFDMAGTRALLFDRRGNYETALTVDAMVRRGCAVTIVTPFLHFGYNLGRTMLAEYMRLIPKWQVDVQASASLQAIRDGAAHVRNALSGKVQASAFDFIVAGVHPRAQKQLFDMLQGFAPTHAVGDAVAPRSALEAIREGDRIGRTL